MGRAKAEAPAPGLVDEPQWYRDAVIYQLHLKSFFDSNDDGVGDFAGLLQKLDYVAELGVDTLWLLPFYPSPRKDDGYDIADYLGVHPDYGTLHDARRFIREAHARGLRVITELVINHTSDQHPWFQRARLAKPGSSHHNTTCGRRPTSATRARASSSSTPRSPTGPGTRWRMRISGTVSTATSPT
nr:alpha-amylase family glycosyl hydrolase [Siccirubricoccus sp. G192]